MPPQRSSGLALCPWRLILQILLIILALLYWHHPVLSPIKILVVLLHEVSHGLMALATGGTVQEIVISVDETGACRTTGGNDHLIISAGYLGSMFFGGLLLSASRCRVQVSVTCGLLAMLLLGAALTVIQDDYSRRFAFAMAGTSLLMGLILPGFVATLALRTVGTISSLYALIDIYNDTLSEVARSFALRSDASALAELTGVPATTVGAGWLIVSAAYFFTMLRSSVRPAPAGEELPAGTPAPAEAKT